MSALPEEQAAWGLQCKCLTVGRQRVPVGRRGKELCWGQVHASPSGGSREALPGSGLGESSHLHWQVRFSADLGNLSIVQRKELIRSIFFWFPRAVPLPPCPCSPTLGADWGDFGVHCALPSQPAQCMKLLEAPLLWETFLENVDVAGLSYWVQSYLPQECGLPLLLRAL